MRRKLQYGFWWARNKFLRRKYYEKNKDHIHAWGGEAFLFLGRI